MPAYKYICNKCHTRFELILGIKELDKKEEVTCPKCGCKNVETRPSSLR